MKKASSGKLDERRHETRSTEGKKRQTARLRRPLNVRGRARLVPFSESRGNREIKRQKMPEGTGTSVKFLRVQLSRRFTQRRGRVLYRFFFHLPFFFWHELVFRFFFLTFHAPANSVSA